MGKDFDDLVSSKKYDIDGKFHKKRMNGITVGEDERFSLREHRSSQQPYRPIQQRQCLVRMGREHLASADMLNHQQRRLTRLTDVRHSCSASTPIHVHFCSTFDNRSVKTSTLALARSCSLFSDSFCTRNMFRIISETSVSGFRVSSCRSTS